MTKKQMVLNAFEAVGVNAPNPEIQQWIKNQYHQFVHYGSFSTLRKEYLKKQEGAKVMPAAAQETTAPAQEEVQAKFLAAAVAEDGQPVAAGLRAKTITVTLTRQEAWALIRAAEYHGLEGQTDRNVEDVPPARWATERIFKHLLDQIGV